MFFRVFFFIVFLSPWTHASANEWLGPFSIKSVSTEANECGSSCSKYYRLKVYMNETVQTSCVITASDSLFSYSAMKGNFWSDEWLSQLSAAAAQNKKVMIYTNDKCHGELGLTMLGVKVIY